MAHYEEVGMQECADELAWGRGDYEYDFTSFSQVPKFAPLLMENFECRKHDE
jgi:hypothetical protein